jgi:hypothetical protein
MNQKDVKRTLVVQNAPKDFPFYEIAAAVKKHAAAGDECYQKFTCAKCGQRLTMDIPNIIYETGTCDRCGHLTDIKSQGCNFLLSRSLR